MQPSEAQHTAQFGPYVILSDNHCNAQKRLEEQGLEETHMPDLVLGEAPTW